MSMCHNARFPLAAGFLTLVTVLTSAMANAQSTSESESRTLYQRLGGLMPISVVVSDLIDVLVTDPEINRNPAVDAARKRVPAPYLKFQVTAQVCQVTGGPCKYTGRSMKEAHAHLNITEGEWQRMVTLLKQVLAKHKVPAQESRELLDIVNSTKPDIVTRP
ncbi:MULTISPECIES: group 1 truncated hemoglobin [unclassified Microbulbifer]|uniref:group I truncated hemoglobin n=1 Tax=unclassified Microbulbifer TaxID=2619833 RepID=UPI0027E5A44C|nr:MULTISPECIES: group 1 truncated hemoglobin [unclassified Microbulbifer]